MTEIEIQELEKEALSHEIDPKVEMEWTKDQLQRLKVDENSLMSVFKLWKHTRDDERMKSCAKDLKECRVKITYLSTRLGELIAQQPPEAPK